MQFDGNGHLYVPDNEKIYFGASADLQIYHDGSNSFIKDAGTGNLKVVASVFQVRNAADNETMIEAHDNGQVEIYHNDTKRIESTNYGARVYGNFENHDNFITVKDAGKFTAGNSNDLTIEHDGSNSRIRNVTGQLQLRSDSIALENNDGSNYAAITGLRLLDNAKARFGSSNDLEIYHDGSNSYLKNTQGQTRLVQDYFAVRNGADNEYMIYGQVNNTVQLYYDGSVKLATTSSGVEVTGTCTATAFSGDGSALTNVSGGKILQVAAGNVTSTSSGSFSAGSYTDTPATVTITSTEDNSKFIIAGSIGGEGTKEDYQIYMSFIRVVGGSSTPVNVGDADGNRSRVTSMMPSGYHLSNQATTPSTIVLAPYLDSPSQSAGTAITYKIAISGSNSGTFYYGRTKDNNNQAYSERLPCHITVMEVAA